MSVCNSTNDQNLEAHVFLGIGQYKQKISLNYLRAFLIFINFAILMCAMLCFSAGRHARIIIENNLEEVEKSREDFLSKAYHHEQEDLKAQELGLEALHHEEHTGGHNHGHEHSDEQFGSDAAHNQEHYEEQTGSDEHGYDKFDEQYVHQIYSEVEEHTPHKEIDNQHGSDKDGHQVKTSNHTARVEEREEGTSHEHEEHSHQREENSHHNHIEKDQVNTSNHRPLAEENEATSKNSKKTNNRHGFLASKDQEMIQEMVSAVHIHIENILYLISSLLFFSWIVFGVFISYDFGGPSEVSVLVLVIGLPYTVALVLWEVGLAVLFHKMVIWAPITQLHPLQDFYSDWMLVPTFLKLSGVAQLITAFLPFVVYYLPSDYLHEMPEHIGGFQRTSISAGQLMIDAMRKDHQIHTSEKPLCDMFLGKYIPHPRLQAADTLAGGVTIFNHSTTQTEDIMLFQNFKKEFSFKI